MLGLFASPATMVPFVLIPSVVLALSIGGLIVTGRQVRPFAKWIGYPLHAMGFCLSISLLGYLGLLSAGIGSGEETYLIPDGYQGVVYVIYPATYAGSPRVSPKKAEYVIPPDGVFLSRSSAVKDWNGWTKTRYYYVSRNGQRTEITELWDSTIPETPENLSNTRDVGVFFPRTGFIGDSKGCQIRFAQFYVGTKAKLLRNYHELDLNGYLHARGIGC